MSQRAQPEPSSPAAIGTAADGAGVSDPVLDPEEISLWVRWRSSSDQAARGVLVERYMHLVRIIAAAIYRSANYGYVEFRDLLQLGVVGLLESIARFEPRAGASFAGFARKRIRGAILNGLEAQSEHHAQLAFRRRLRKERTKSLMDGAKANHRSSPFLQMVEIATGLAVGHMLEGTAMYVDPASERGTYNDNSEVHASAEAFRYLLGKLPAMQAKILDLHYLNGVQFDEVAALVGLSKGRISQLHSAAILTLRRYFRERGSLDLSV